MPKGVTINVSNIFIIKSRNLPSFYHRVEFKQKLNCVKICIILRWIYELKLKFGLFLKNWTYVMAVNGAIFLNSRFKFLKIVVEKTVAVLKNISIALIISCQRMSVLYLPHKVTTAEHRKKLRTSGKIWFLFKFKILRKRSFGGKKMDTKIEAWEDSYACWKILKIWSDSYLV